LILEDRQRDGMIEDIALSGSVTFSDGSCSGP